MARIDYYHDPSAPKANSIVVAVTAFVQDDAGRLLMIRRTDNDLYAMPGGAQEIGETVSEAAVREVEEETGLKIEVTGLIGIYSDPSHIIAYPDGEVRQEFAICLRGKTTGGEIHTSTESSEVRWIDTEDLSSLRIHPSIWLRINHGLSPREAPYYS